MKIQEISKRIDTLIDQGEKTLKTADVKYVDTASFRAFRSACLSFIQKVYGNTHPYYLEFNESVDFPYLSRTKSGIEILKVIKQEVESGWYFTIRQMITADIFSDLLERAEYLLDAKYKDAAAVMIGSVLEEHLRELCKKSGIAISTTKNNGDSVAKKAEQMNQDLAAGEVYNSMEQKGVTSYLAVRNLAAHGKYQDFDQRKVEEMLKGVTDFINRNPT